MSSSKSEDDSDLCRGLSEDDRYFIHKGRRWRKTDPSIPSSLQSELVKELMAARRAVKQGKADNSEEAIKAARRRVQDAKVALGERGHAWWLPTDPAALAERLSAAMRALLRKRSSDSTICPSDAARIAAGANWRDWMPLAREQAWSLEAAGWLIVTQKGQRVNREAKGAIRLKRLKK